MSNEAARIILVIAMLSKVFALLLIPLLRQPRPRGRQRRR
jgi:hypothetical protein